MSGPEVVMALVVGNKPVMKCFLGYYGHKHSFCPLAVPLGLGLFTAVSSGHFTTITYFPFTKDVISGSSIHLGAISAWGPVLN